MKASTYNATITLLIQSGNFNPAVGTPEMRILTSIPMDMMEYEIENEHRVKLFGNISMICWVCNKFGQLGINCIIE